MTENFVYVIVVLVHVAVKERVSLLFSFANCIIEAKWVKNLKEMLPLGSISLR